MSELKPGEAPIVVLGGTKGLGRCVSLQLAARGESVIALARTRPAFIEQDSTGRLSFEAVDFEDANAVRVVLGKIKAKHPMLRGLVLAQRYRGTGDAWEGELRAGLETSRLALEICTDVLAPGSGVVAISSVAAQSVLTECSTGYHVAKAAIEQLVRCYAVKWGSRGVRVNAVAPSLFTKAESRDFYAREREIVRYYETITPLGRMGTAEEIARVVCFLVGPEASFITGQILTVDGGMSLPWADSTGRAVKQLAAPA